MQGARIDSTHSETLLSAAGASANLGQIFVLAAARLRSVGNSLWRAGRRHKALVVRETAALGDRRFVSVIQFEQQRFLVGSSPSSVTLLSVLPDEILKGDGNESQKENGEKK